MRLIFLGPPGVGKGTQAEGISSREGIEHISSGELLRRAVDAETAIGSRAKGFIEQGMLVPDELVVDIVADRINSVGYEKGFILDGFPRNLSQAEILDSTLCKVNKKIDRVFSFTAAEDVIITRLVGRRICKTCGLDYHATLSPPTNDNVCDKCGSALFQREDDSSNTIKVRLEVFKEQAGKLIDYYHKQGILVEVNCDGDKAEIQQNVLEALQSISGEERE